MHWKRRWASTQCLFQCIIVAFCHVRLWKNCAPNGIQLVTTDDINALSFELVIDRTYEIWSVKVKKELRRGHSMLLLVINHSR
ncbi:hypothetical protein BJV74DRAFT_838384 [Russula compacta]|nr:hypothetical protein BJV74DRAFT_838384 [Russula compacta]